MDDSPLIYAGTSGWAYSWNEGGDLAWYVGHSGLNAVELNMSFYRFPSESQIGLWRETGPGLSWSVKVHRSVTHFHLANETGQKVFSRFLDLFRPLDPFVSYYLFQFPHRFDTTFRDRLTSLFQEFDDRKMALEFRHPSWGDPDLKALPFRGVIVTPDSPDSSGGVFGKNGQVYLRFHGRTAWYSGDYSEKELSGVIASLPALSPRIIHAFFNNDHHMLDNARLFRNIAEKIWSKKIKAPKKGPFA